MDKKYYFFDANAFYFYIDDFNILRMDNPPIVINKYKKLLKNKNKVLPLCVLQEVLVHFRSNIDIVKRIARCIIEENIKIFNNDFNDEASIDTFKLIYKADEKNINDLISGLLKSKIQHEAKMILFIVNCLMKYYILSICIINSSIDVVLFMELCFKYFIYDMEKDALDEIIKKLKKGYNEDKVDKVSKEIIKEILCDCIATVDYFMNDIKDNTILLTDIDSKYAAKVRNLEKKYIEKGSNIMVRICNNRITDCDYLCILKKSIIEEAQSRGYSIEEANYIIYKFDNWINTGKNLEKNDVFDCMFIGTRNKSFFYLNNKISNLSCNKINLVSFDLSINMYLKSYYIDNYKFNYYFLTKEQKDRYDSY